MDEDTVHLSDSDEAKASVSRLLKAIEGWATKESQKNEEAKAVIHNALKKAFAPEFLNRVDDMILFNPLERKHIHLIIDIELAKLFGRVTDLGYKIELSDQAKDHIAEKGFDEKFGARPLKRAIQKYLEDPLAEQIIQTKLNEGDKLMVDLNKNNEIEVKVTRKRKAKSTKTADEKKAADTEDVEPSEPKEE